MSRKYSTDDDEWVYGHLLFDMIVAGESYEKHRGYSINTATVGQWTGLKDKNGVEIYEGDIIQFAYGTVIVKGVIVWYGIGWYFKEITKMHSYIILSEWLCNMYCGDVERFEVIGNIHDNPEMIEEVE